MQPPSMGYWTHKNNNCFLEWDQTPIQNVDPYISYTLGKQYLLRSQPLNLVDVRGDIIIINIVFRNMSPLNFLLYHNNKYCL
jgi:hypothetical protein